MLSFFVGIYKKLVCAGRRKGCEKIALWAKSISNHLYWCAASSDNNAELIVSKWLSITNHVADIHQGHEGKFPVCEHGDITEESAWMTPGTIKWIWLNSVK